MRVFLLISHLGEKISPSTSSCVINVKPSSKGSSFTIYLNMCLQLILIIIILLHLPFTERRHFVLPQILLLPLLLQPHSGQNLFVFIFCTYMKCFLFSAILNKKCMHHKIRPSINYQTVQW